MPQINERLNAMTYNEINHDSLESVLNEILPELKGSICSSIDGASTPLTRYWLSKETAYYRRCLKYRNHLCDNVLEKEQWYNDQLNTLRALNSKIITLSSYSHEPFKSTETTVTFDTFHLNYTPTSYQESTKTAPSKSSPTILNGVMRQTKRPSPLSTTNGDGSPLPSKSDDLDDPDDDPSSEPPNAEFNSIDLNSENNEEHHQHKRQN